MLFSVNTAFTIVHKGLSLSTASPTLTRLRIVSSKDTTISLTSVTGTSILPANFKEIALLSSSVSLLSINVVNDKIEFLNNT